MSNAENIVTIEEKVSDYESEEGTVFYGIVSEINSTLPTGKSLI